MQHLQLTEFQATIILELQLQRLTQMERMKVAEEPRLTEEELRKLKSTS
jgi:DNA gyrase/topoisomerase IV subunit A